MTQKDGTFLLVVTDYAEICPKTWEKLATKVNPKKVTEIHLCEEGVIHTHAFSVFTKLRKVIFKGRQVIKPHAFEGCFLLKKIRLPLDGMRTQVWKQPIYEFDTLMLPRGDRFDMPSRWHMVFRWKESEEWIGSPIDEEETEKAKAQQQLVVDHGVVDNFRMVCLYWVGDKKGYYSEMDAFTRIYSMYVPGLNGVIARIVKKPEGAIVKLHDPEDVMLNGDIQHFFSYDPVIVIPQAEKVGEGIPLTVEFRGKEYAITGWGKSSRKTLLEFIRPQLQGGKQRKEPKIDNIEVLKFEYTWEEDEEGHYEGRDFEWQDMKDVTMLQFLYYVMSWEVDPTRIIKVNTI